VRPIVLVLTVALTAIGCAHYAKLENPSPIEDLESDLRMEGLAHLRLKPGRDTMIEIRARVEVARGGLVALGDTVALLLDWRDSTRLLGHGVRLRAAADTSPVLFTGGTVETFTVPVRHTGPTALDANTRYRLRLVYRRSRAGEPMAEAQSRLYQFRIQRVSYIPMAILSAVPIGALLALLSK
jgi:hypothetical protein